MKNYLDESLEIKWKELDDIPFYEAYDDLIISKDWWIFKKGTTRENIWKYFDKHHTKGVYYLLYEFR